MADGDRFNPKALLQFPFSTGIDEANRDEIVEPGGGWAVLENGRQDHRGGYSTRNGFAALTRDYDGGSNPSGGQRVFADDKTIVRIADAQIDSYSTTQTAWEQRGRVPDASCRLIGVPTMGSSTYLEDMETLGGVTVLSWLSITGGNAYAYLAVFDEASGAVLRAPEKIGTSTTFAPMLLSKHGNYIVAVRVNSAGTDIEAWALDTSASAVHSGWVAFGAALATDLAGGYVLQSLPGATTPSVAVLYINNSGGTSRLTLKTFTVAGGVLATQTINTNSTTPGAAAMGAYSGAVGDTLWLTWNEGTAIKVRGVNPNSISTDLATKATIMTMATGCNYLGIAGSSTAGRARVFGNDTDTTKRGKMSTVLTSGGAAVAGGAGTLTVPNVKMVRKPFQYNGRFYGAFFGSDDPGSTNTQANFIICDWSEEVTYLRPIANPAPALASAGLNGQGKFVVGSTSSKWIVGLGVTRSGVATSSAIAELDFADSRRWQSCSFGGSTYLSGGLVSCFDGARCAESGFLLRPPQPTGAASGIGAITATWRYICVYEEVDADGNWHQSGLSTPSAVVTMTNNTTATVTTSPLAISSRISSAGASATSVRVAFYRTATGGAAPYYRVGTTINDTTATTVTFADSTTDAVLTTGAKLYSQPLVNGTSQDKRPPPPFQCIASYNGMLVGASGSDVWYSGQNVSGEGVWFSPIFQVPIPGDGDITAMWAMDGTLFISKRREIYAITGEAPSDNGSSGGLGQPRRLAVDVGCIEARSTCTTAFGTFFQSDRGIEILTRSQSVEWIGEAVQDTQSTYPVVTSATVDPVSCTVLIECAASESAGLVTGGGRTLVYDLSLRQWVSTDRRASGAGTVDAPSQSACMIYVAGGYRYAWISSLGVVHYETPSVHLDADGTLVCKRAISANVKAAGLQGLQHVNKTLLLAKYHTPHDLNMSFAYNYSSTYETARLYTYANIATVVAALPNMQLEHPMHDNARCEAVRIQLQDVTPSSDSIGTGQGATWVALAFEVVPQTGAYGLPDVSR